MTGKRFFSLLLISMTSTLFLTGCPGASDYDIELPGNYSIVRTSAHEVTISPKINETVWGAPVIPTKVTEVAYDDTYIIAKQVQLTKDPDNSNEIPSEHDTHFWILECKTGEVTGPLSEPDFAKKKQEFQISDELVLKKVSK